MTRILDAFRRGADGEPDPVAEAMRPRSCRCGLTFGSRGAYLVHFEAGVGSRCLPPGARGQLVERDGVWCLPGSDAARS
jgi:hypothetical protein